MAQNWDYAELSKDAKVAGGPEKYVEMLELASKEAGKMEMGEPSEEELAQIEKFKKNGWI